MDTNKSNQHVINIRIYFPSEKKIKIYVTIYNTYCRTLYIYSIFLIKIEIVYIVNIECQSVRIVGVPRSRFDVCKFWVTYFWLVVALVGHPPSWCRLLMVQFWMFKYFTQSKNNRKKSPQKDYPEHIGQLAHV